MTGWVGWAGHAVSASSRHVSARVRDTVLVTRLVLDTAMDTCRSHVPLIGPHVVTWLLIGQHVTLTRDT